MGPSRFVERRDDVGGLEDHPCTRPHQEPGVVIEHVQDLDLGPVFETPVGDVLLPTLVGHSGLESDVRAPRPLLGLRGDEAATGKDPPDRRDRRAGPAALLEVVGDRVGPGIEALIRQPFAELDDRVLDRLRGP